MIHLQSKWIWIIISIVAVHFLKLSASHVPLLQVFKNTNCNDHFEEI